MAQPDVISGSKLLVQIGDGATPTEAFTHKCMINLSRSINFSAETQSDDVPDCAAPDAPAWKTLEVVSYSCTIEGAGYYDAKSDDFFFTWLTSGESKNVKFKVDMVGASTFTGKFKLTSRGISGDRKAKAQNTMTLVSDGPVTRVTNT